MNNLREGIHEQDMSWSPLPLRQRGSEEREISLCDQDEEVPLGSSKRRRTSYNVILHQAQREDFSLIMRMAEYMRAKRFPVIERQRDKRSRETHSGEPRITSTGIVVGPTPSIETLLSSNEHLRVPVTGILKYGGGTVPPSQPRTGMSSTTAQRLASGGGSGGDDSSSGHSQPTNG